jgi:cytochrome P450
MEAEGRSLVDRPPSITAGEMLPDGMCIVLARSRERFRRLRKAVHTHLQPKAAEAYNDMQHDNARKFVLDILNDSKNHQKHTARYVLTKSFCDLCIDMLSPVEGIQHPSFFG